MFDFYNLGVRYCQVFGGTPVGVPLPPRNCHATIILHYCCNNTCLMSTAPATHTVCRSCAQAPMSDVNHALGFVVQQNGHGPTLHHVSVMHRLSSCCTPVANIMNWNNIGVYAMVGLSHNSCSEHTSCFTCRHHDMVVCFPAASRSQRNAFMVCRAGNVDNKHTTATITPSIIKPRLQVGGGVVHSLIAQHGNSIQNFKTTDRQ